MAWKNLKQRSLADSMLINHDTLKEVDDAHELINWSHLERLLSDIHSCPKGEKAWPPLPWSMITRPSGSTGCHLPDAGSRDTELVA